MSAYSYDRTAASVPSLSDVLVDFLAKVAKSVGDEIPKHLKSDSLKINNSGRLYTEAVAKGYTRGDLEAETTVSITMDFQPVRVRASCFFKDVGMTRAREQEFTIAYDESPAELGKAVASFLKDV